MDGRIICRDGSYFVVNYVDDKDIVEEGSSNISWFYFDRLILELMYVEKLIYLEINELGNSKD